MAPNGAKQTESKMSITETNASDATWNWGGKAIKLSETPLASIVALINRGSTHIHGSETSSAATSAKVRSVIEAMSLVPTKEARKEAEDKIRAQLRVEAFSKSDEFAAKAQAIRDEFLAEIMAGTLGETSERGPKLSPLEAEMAIEVRAKVKALMQAKGAVGMWGKNGTAFPKPDYVFDLDTGPRTWENLLAGYAAKFDVELRKSAQATLDRKAREAQKLAEQAKKAGGQIDF